MNKPSLTRREFLASSASLILAATIHAAEPPVETARLIIDIHQHTNYSGRTDEQLIAHQRAMRISQTILLPAGTPVDRPSTHDGKSNGLATKCGGKENCLDDRRCMTHELWAGLNTHIFAYLRSVTLEELVRQQERPEVNVLHVHHSLPGKKREPATMA